jgi:hypothetical protein
LGATLPSVKTRCIERSAPDKDIGEEARNQGEEVGQDTGLSVGVPVEDREAFHVGEIQHWFAVRV